MFEIENKIIKITKGDSAAIKCNLKNADGSDYIMKSGDKLTMTVRKKAGESILMAVESTSNILDLTPTDTNKLVAGQCVYDIQLTTSVGDVFTIAGLTDKIYTNMVVYPEITEG